MDYQTLTRSEIKAMLKELNVDNFHLYETDPNPQIRTIATNWLRSSLKEQKSRVISAQRKFRRICYNTYCFLQAKTMAIPVYSYGYVKGELRYRFDHQSLSEALRLQYGLKIPGSRIILVDNSRMDHTLIDLFTPLQPEPYDPEPHYLARVYVGCGLIAELKYTLYSIGAINADPSDADDQSCETVS
jgi:hypothetical protein